MLLKVIGNLLRGGRAKDDGATRDQAGEDASGDSAAELIRQAEHLAKAGRLEDALSCYRSCARAHPGSRAAYIGIGNALVDLWCTHEAIEAFEKALELAPGSAELFSAILFFHHYRIPPDRERILELSRRFGQVMERAVPRMAPAGPAGAAPGRRVRVGYVSPNFSRHSVGYFMTPVIAHHDRDRFEVYCYYSHALSDDTTDRVRQLADGWRDIVHLDDDTVARMVRADGIDILVDLAGHSKGNRLGVFARKPAPVQMTWLGYPDTTGLAAIDYRITDRIADPQPEADRWHTERLLRMDDLFLTYQPPEDSPPGAARDAPASGVVFGSFNNLAKLNEPTVRLWSQILSAVPDSRLVIKAGSLSYQGAVERFTDCLEGHGVDADRVELLGWVQGRREHLALYDQVDIALDTFPYNGTTTTCEALWMGVPVVSLAGDAHMSRVGATLLRSVGLDDLVAASGEDYMRIAVELAQDAGRRRALRTGLRARMQSSPLLDHRAFTRKLERRFLESLTARA